jgi:PAS domain S-box-containing protein
MGLAVLLGWHARIATLVQIFPGMVPMQYNTALCFVALGLAGLVLSPRRRWGLLCGGGFVGLMSAVVLLEYASDRALRIDTLFFSPWVSTLSAHPGRMALTTALSFCITGSSLFILGLRPKSYASLGILNAVTVSLGLTSLVGYGLGVTYVLPFSLGSQMALHTSLAFLAYGIAMLGAAWRHAEPGPDGLPKWSAKIGVALLPMLLVGASALISERSWRTVPLQALVAVAGVALITSAIRKLITAKIAYKGLLMMVIPLILLLAFVSMVTRVKQQSEAAQRTTLHSAEVIMRSQALLTQLAEAESAVRGYVITGDELFVVSANRSIARVPDSIARLRSLVEDNPDQTARIAGITQLTVRRTQRFEEIFRLIRAGNRTSAQADIQEENGLAFMQQLLAETTAFDNEERRLAAERQQNLESSWQRLSWLLSSGAAAGILLAGILALMFSGSISRRLKALRDNASNLAAGRTLAPPLTGSDEIAELDRVFHAMAESLDTLAKHEKADRALQEQTQDVRHSEALLKTGALQSAIFNSANFSSIATDAKGVIQIFNVGAERMLGYAAADVMNTITPADISDPQEVIVRAQALSIELGTPITPGFEALVFKASRGIEDIYELTYIRKDGTRLPAVVSVTALRDPQDAIIGYLLIGTDNTARKQIEEERKKLDQRLRDQQFYTRSLIESNTDAIITTDPLGIITDVNKQMEALTGSTRDELIGAPFKSCFTDPERAEAGIKLVLGDKKVTDYELTARARDGTETVVSYNATTFHDRERRLQGVFVAARDITERKRSEQALQISNTQLESAKSVAEKANLAKSDFLSSMSHELRSPLNAILGFAQLMESSTPVPTPVQAARITQILQAGWHLLNLINEILDLAVIESGKVSLSLEPVSLVEVMSECQTMMEPQAQERGIRMTFPHFEQPIFVWSDRTRLKQVVINLLSNAIKYNKEGGSVLVECVETLSGRTRISVRDTGVGLVPEKIEQLFQPFNRLGQESSGVAGTGIGLVVTKQLVELMEGSIGVESEATKGSVFWIELRTMLAPELLPEPEPMARGQTFGPFSELTHTLLYIEDNPANMMLVEQIIEQRSDIKLLTAVDGLRGFELARAARPDVILMDINLPGLSGNDVLKLLHHDPLTAHIPVVALSANAMLRDVRLGLDAGFFRYLTKPINMKEFMETLNMAIAHAGEHPRIEPKPEAGP